MLSLDVADALWACERVAAIGIAGQRFLHAGRTGRPDASAWWPPTPSPRTRRAYAPSLANAFHLVRVQAVDLADALALTLLENGGGLVERPFEERVQPRIAGDLATNVANGPADIVLSLRSALLARLNCLAWA